MQHQVYVLMDVPRRHQRKPLVLIMPDGLANTGPLRPAHTNGS
jgi:hypothetical protein